MKNTLVFVGDAKYDRTASLELEDDKVIFDCSDGEYGPIQFPLEQLEEAIKQHKNKQS